MKTLSFFAMLPLLGASTLAQATAQNGSHNPAVKDSTAMHVAASAHGANSFTRAQVRGRLAKAGYTGVSALAKDAQGAWNGTAMKDGKAAHVALDYKGNITAR